MPKNNSTERQRRRRKIESLLMNFCLMFVFGSLTICSLMSEIFRAENLANFIAVSAQNCQFKPVSLALYLANIELQVRVLFGLSITTFVLVVILLLTWRFLRNRADTIRVENCTLFLLVLFAMSLTGRSNSLCTKVKEVSPCQTNNGSFSSLTKSSSTMYTLSWFIMVLVICLLIFSLELTNQMSKIVAKIAPTNQIFQNQNTQGKINQRKEEEYIEE